jgi:hypothetical protein
MTEQTLSQFYQSAQDYGFSRDYQARVSQLTINGNTLGDDRLVYLKSMSLPSKKAAISTVKYYGVDINATGTRDFGESKQWELTFLTDQVLSLKRWFEQRLEEVSSNPLAKGQKRPVNANPVPGTNSLAQIDVIDDNLETVVRYTLNGLFVVSTPGITYNLDGSGKVQEFKVTLGYQTWEAKDLITKESYASFNANGGAVGGGVTTGGNAAGGSTSALGSLLNGLRTVTQVAGAIRGTANAVGGAAQALRGARTAIRGRR